MDQKLAIQGGQKLNKESFPPWPSLAEKGILRAAEVLRSGKINYWTGPLGQEFEKKWAGYNGARFGASNSAGCFSKVNAKASTPASTASAISRSNMALWPQ